MTDRLIERGIDMLRLMVCGLKNVDILGQIYPYEGRQVATVV